MAKKIVQGNDTYDLLIDIIFSLSPKQATALAKELVAEFGQEEVDKAMYRLDRLLLTNRQQCPRNIKKYLHKRLKKSRDVRNKKE